MMHPLLFLQPQPIRRAVRSVALVIALIAISAVSAGFVTHDASAASNRLMRGLQDKSFTSSDPLMRDQWLNEGVTAQAQLVRMNVYWRNMVTASAPPADPTDPSDPAYDFANLDAAVRDAAARGFTLLFTILDAPPWAEGANREQGTPTGTWKPDPAALGAFGEALGRRYSGAYAPTPLDAPLPAVKYLEAWNEPNLFVYISPQYRGKKNVGAIHYRKMLNAFYEGVKRGNSDAKVIAGATAPFGEDGPNAERTRPLTFMREVLCLKERKRRLRKAKCSNPARFDIYSHHPISIYGGPRKSGANRDDVNAAIDMSRVINTLRFAERRRTISQSRRHPVWVSEFFWQSNPPEDTQWAFPIRKQAQWIQEEFYLLWKEGVSTAIYFQLVDEPFADVYGGGLQAGLFFEDGRVKPSLQAFRFPFVTERKSKGRLIAWTMPPDSGTLAIEKKVGARWKTAKRLRVKAGRPVWTKMKLRGRASLRADLEGEQSLVWRQGRGSNANRARRRSRASVPISGTSHLLVREAQLYPYRAAGD